MGDIVLKTINTEISTEITADENLARLIKSYKARGLDDSLVLVNVRNIFHYVKEDREHAFKMLLKVLGSDYYLRLDAYANYIQVKPGLPLPHEVILIRANAFMERVEKGEIDYPFLDQVTSTQLDYPKASLKKYKKYWQDFDKQKRKRP